MKKVINFFKEVVIKIATMDNFLYLMTLLIAFILGLYVGATNAPVK